MRLARRSTVVAVILAMVLASASAIAQRTVAPVIGNWDYGENRCGVNLFGYPDEQAAIEGGAYRNYVYTRTCPWYGVPRSNWGTDAQKVPGSCGSTVYYPQYTLGVESINSRQYHIYYNFGSTCQNGPTFDGLTVYRRRPVFCPAGFTAQSNKCVRAPTAVDPQKNCDNCQAGANGSNPIQTALGHKLQYEVDVETASGLRFARYYSSAGHWGETTMGSKWRHSYDAMVLLSASPSADVPVTAWVQRSDGALYGFNRIGDDQWVPEVDVALSLEPIRSAEGELTGWRLRDRANRVETYDALGRLVLLEDAEGGTIALAYQNGRLTSISDRHGRSIALEYDASHRIAAVVDPAGATHRFEYDALGNLVAVARPDIGGSVQKRIYHYEDTRFPHALTGITDESGLRHATWAYDPSGRANLSVHGSESGSIDRVSLVYNTDGSTTVTDAHGLVRKHSFALSHGVRRLAGLSVPCASCGEIRKAVTYDANGFVDVEAGFDGTLSDSDHDARGLLVQKIESANDASTRRTTRNDWHPTLPLLLEKRVLDADGVPRITSRWTYNTRGQPLTTTTLDPATGTARTTTTTYCEQPDITAGACPLPGLVTSIDGPRTDVNDATTYSYYPSDAPSCATSPTTCAHRKGDLWMTMDAVGHVTETLRYDGAGRILSVRDPNGVVTDYEYHPRGWLTARKMRGTDDTTEADDRITQIDYLPTGLVQKVTLPDGSHTTYTYDAAHRLTDITDGEGNRIHYTLDNAGNRINEDTRGHTGAVLRTLSRVYNQLGQLQTHKDAYAHATGYTYDANGNTDRVTDALGRITDHDYDPLNRLSKTIQNVGGLNVTTRFQYDALDHLTEVTDPNGHTTKYTWNGLGDLTRLASPDTGLTTYTYDEAGNRTSQTDARGVTATYRYDALNRLISIRYPDNTLDVAYQYDAVAPACGENEGFAIGRLSRITDGSGDTQYCYDRFGHLVRKVQTTVGQTHAIRYAYTEGGQLAAIEYPDGTVADYIRDALGRTTEIGITRPGTPREVLLTSAGYYPFGPAAEWVFGKTRLFQRTLNQNYQPGIVQDQNSGGLSLGYEFDPVGNLIKLRTGDQGEPPLRSYGYDALNRLIEARDGASDALLHGYTYDPTGNRTSATEGGTTTPYAIAPYSHHLLAVGNEARSYDPNGNTTATGTARTFIYNDANRMVEAINNGQAATYAYNGKGEQVLRHSTGHDTVFLHDEAGHWLGEYDSSGQPVQQVVWLDDLPIGLIVGPAAANEPLHYIEADALGTPRVVIESQRNVAVWEWPLTGEAFGKEAPNEGPDGNGVQLVFNLRFPGQVVDLTTNRHDNGFRQFEPQSGRYSEPDPIGLAGGISTFSYVGSNPLGYVDPFGLAPGDCYSTMDLAAANAIMHINPRSVRLDREHGGWIYRTANGWYSYTAPILGNTHSIGIGQPVPHAVGSYHTHGAESPGFDGERFSAQDLNSRKLGHTDYLGTPSLRLLRDNGWRVEEVDTRPLPDNADACSCSGQNSILNELWNDFWR